MFNFTQKNCKKNELFVLLYFVQYIHSITFEFFNSILIGNRGIICETTYINIDLILEILMFHTPFRFNSLRDIVTYDRPDYFLRYVVIYVLRNVERDFDIRVRFSAKSQTTIIPTITSLLSSGQWAEREVFDFFGIKFFGNTDMRKILSDYSFWGFAGRKDFPLVGIHSFVYSLNFLRVTKIRGNLKDFWSLFFQKSMLESNV